MAVTITQTANPNGVAASSTVATYTGVSIGTADPDRIIAVCVASELANSTASACTIDYGSGDTAMTAGSAGNFGAVYARIFYLLVPTGTTATIKVTFSAVSPSETQNHIAVYNIGTASYSTEGNDGTTDMDVSDPLTTGSITIATGGGFLAVAAGANDAGTKTWANATEDIDADAGAFEFTTAKSTTGGTVTVTCTGGTNNEDGALSWMLFTARTDRTATVADTYVTSQVDAVVLTKSSTLTVADAYVTSQTDAVVLSKSNNLTVADSSVTSQVDTTTLVEGYNLAVADGASTTQADNITLEEIASSGRARVTWIEFQVPEQTGITITVADAYSTTQTDAVGLSKSDTLALDDTFVTSQTDAISLTKSDTLTLADVFVTSQADVATLTRSDTLTLADAYVTTQSDAVVPTKSDTLTLADAYVVTQSDNIVLTGIGIDLTVDDAYVVSQADNVGLFWAVVKAWTLQNRDIIWSLDSRDLDWNLQNRDTVWSIDDRDVTFTLRNRVIDWSVDDR